jgi:hypothetical protein
LSDQEIAHAPLSGGRFVVDVGVKGLPETLYVG